MKQLVCLVCALWSVISLTAQQPVLLLSTDKTTSLIFPLPVKHVDRGSAAFLVEQVPGRGNILLVKAARTAFNETNLSVITEDGSLYAFSVCFDPDPAVFSFALPLQTSQSVFLYAQMILDNPPLLHRTWKERWGMRAALTGLYVRSEALYCQLTLENNGAIDYDIDFLRFALRDKKQGKRTAVQEVELAPLYIAGNQATVNAESRTTLVAVLPKFTIPDKKHFVIEIGEKGGGRHFQLRLGNRKIVQAMPLPDLQ